MRRALLVVLVLALFGLGVAYQHWMVRQKGETHMHGMFEDDKPPPPPTKPRKVADTMLRKLDRAKFTKTASGLEYRVLKKGSGPMPKKGQTAQVRYTGWLTDGTKFDSSVDSGAPFEFQLGTGGVIGGWDEGVALMKVGDKAKFIIPPSLGYGSAGSPPKIPADATLIFDVELLRVKKS